jgi:hypothetical protein
METRGEEPSFLLVAALEPPPPPPNLETFIVLEEIESGTNTKGIVVFPAEWFKNGLRTHPPVRKIRGVKLHRAVKHDQAVVKRGNIKYLKVETKKNGTEKTSFLALPHRGPPHESPSPWQAELPSTCITCTNSCERWCPSGCWKS